MFPSPRKILVTIPTINSPERLKLDGILAYAHEKRGRKWNIALDFAALSGHPATRSLSDYDGIIAYVDGDRRRMELVAAGRPVVLIEDLLAPSRAPRAVHALTLLCDHAAEGRTAADYFLGRHFRSFAWLGLAEETEWSRGRRDGFADALSQAGYRIADFASSQLPLSDWLRSLPRPTALFAACDFRAREALEAATLAGLQLPGDLAILGVDDDTALCTTVSPALSSLPTNDWRLGYDAGRLLNELLEKRRRGGRVVKVAARHVVSRLSTDADALDDRFVAEALRYARNNLSSKLDAASLARRTGYSKRLLQLRTERALGHSLGLEIRRLRLDAALDRLAQTNQPIADIAAACGFTSTSHLSLRVKEATGLTPLAYRSSQAFIS